MSIQNLPPANMRIDYTTADRYVKPQAPRLTFMQKLGRTFGKLVSFAAPIAGSVLAIAAPGVGLPAAYGLFGAGQLARDQLAKAQAKDAMAAQQAQQQQGPLVLPGLFETAPLSQGMASTDFIVPRSLESRVQDVIVQRRSAEVENLNSIRTGPLPPNSI